MAHLGDGIEPRVAIVGAGYAGMAAAATLAARGVPVTVFESGPLPGGRARRVVSRGTTLDNGQHILVGAYSELFRLMRLVGVPDDALLRVPLTLSYAGGFELRARPLPAPFGLLAGLLFARGIALSKRFSAIRFMQKLRSAGFRAAPDETVAALLARHGQDASLGRYLWRPICVSALNTPVEEASANAFLAVLRDTVAAGGRACDLVLPRVDLSGLFPEPAMRFVEAHGGTVKLRSPVRRLEELAEFAGVIVAVGPHQLGVLLPELGLSFAYQPIYTCYLQYPASVRLSFPMLGMADGIVQWAFDRGALIGEHGRLACVISAGGAHQNLSQEALAQACHRALAGVLAGLPAPIWTRVIAEKRATVACTPHRPRAPLEYRGVHLAGDYTDAEYPPTLEAAVRSGVRAALKVAQKLNRLVDALDGEHLQA